MTGSDVRSDEIYTATPAHIGYEAYANTKPVALHYFDAKYSVKKWGLLYVKLAQCLYHDYPDVIEGLRGQSLFGENKRVDIADISFIGKMKQPRLLADDIYLETHLSATNTMRKIKKLLEFCRVDFENVIVSYVLSREAKSPSKKNTDTPIRQGWTQEEAAVLLHALLRVQQKIVHRTDAVQEVSHMLRRYAVACGQTIDSKFRNTNGIAWQLSSLELVFNEQFYKGRNMTRWMVDIVSTYHQHPEQYTALLQNVSEAIAAAEKKGAFSSSSEALEHGSDSAVVSSVGEKTRALLASKIARYFKNGIRTDFVDQNKLRRYIASENPEASLPDDDRELTRAIESIGFHMDGKVFVYAPEDLEKIKARLSAPFLHGQHLIYLDYFYDKHRTELIALHVSSVEQLRTLAYQLLPNLYFHRNCCTTVEDLALDEIIDRFFQSYSSPVAVTDMEAEFPYIPSQYIVNYLSNTEIYTRANTGYYILTENIIISDEEACRIKKEIQQDIALSGIASLTNYELPESLAMNPGLKMYAVQDAFYARYLKTEYRRKRKILSSQGEVRSTNDLMKSFCAQGNPHSRAELANYEALVTGLDGGRILLYADAALIRLDKDHFVPLEHVKITPEMISTADECLARFVRGGIIPISAVTSFAGFPNISEAPWNQFLLQSFCQHFSSYSLVLSSTSDRHEGAIFPKSMSFDNYAELLAAVLIQDHIPLLVSPAGRYLKERGYVYRSKQAAINRAVELAQKAATNGGS